MNAFFKQYKGYTGSYEILPDEACLYGCVQGISGMIEYRSETVKGLEEEFHASVDAYLEMCEEFGEKPEKPFSSNILLRLSPDLHREVHQSAEAEKISKNQFIINSLERSIAERRRDVLNSHHAHRQWSVFESNPIPEVHPASPQARIQAVH